MINQKENPPLAQTGYPFVTTQNNKTTKVRLAVALAIISIYLGSLIIAGIHQLI